MQNNAIASEAYSKHELLLLVSLLFVVITLPIAGSINSISIITLGVVWIGQQHYKNLRLVLNKNFLVFAWFYMLYVFGLSYTSDVKNGGFELEQKISLIALPLIFSTIPTLRKKLIQTMLFTFVLACFCYSTYCLGRGLMLNFENNHLTSIDLNYFTNQNLAIYINSHSTYFSLHIAFSIFILFDIIKNNNWSEKKLFPAVCILLVIFFSVFLFLLASRIVLLAFIFLVIAFFLSRLLKKKIGILSLIVLGAGLFFTLSLLPKSSYFKKRFSEVTQINTNDLIGSNNENGVSQRYFFWKNSVDIIKRSPYVGYGTGDAKTEFKRQYEKIITENPNYPPSVINAIHFFIQNQYNAHNQFLQIMILFGCIGLLSFIAVILLCYQNAFVSKNFLHFSLLTLVFSSCLTECTFDRQLGIVFFMLFTSLFLFHGKETLNA